MTDSDGGVKRKIELLSDDDDDQDLEQRVSVIESTLIDVYNAIQPILPFLRGTRNHHKIPKCEPTTERSPEELKIELDACVQEINRHETLLVALEQDFSVMKVQRGRLHFGKGKPPRQVAPEYHKLSDQIKDKEHEIQMARKELGRLYHVQKSIEPKLNSFS